MKTPTPELELITLRVSPEGARKICTALTVRGMSFGVRYASESNQADKQLSDEYLALRREVDRQRQL